MEDCLLVRTSTFVGGTVYELLSGFNPPEQLRRAEPKGVLGKKWWLESPDGRTLLDRTYLVAIDGTFYWLAEGKEYPSTSQEIVVTQPPALRSPPRLEVTTRTSTPSEKSNTTQTNLQIVELTSPPRLRAQEDLSYVVTGEQAQEERREILAHHAPSVRLSALQVRSADLELPPGQSYLEAEPGGRLHYCKADCPRVCEAPSATVGRFEADAPPPDIKVKTAGPYLTITDVAGGRIDCFNERTQQAHLISCTLTGTARSVEFAFDANGHPRCGRNLPEYQYVYGGSWSSERGKLPGSNGLPSVEGSVNFSLSDVSNITFSPSKLLMQIESAQGKRVYHFSPGWGSADPDDIFEQRDPASEEGRVPKTWTTIDLTSGHGSDCRQHDR